MIAGLLKTETCLTPLFLLMISDWEPGSVRVLHSREGAVWRRAPEAGGAAAALVQHGNDAGAAGDGGEHQRGDPSAGELSPAEIWHF